MVSPAQRRRRRLRIVAIAAAVAMLLSLFVGVITALSDNGETEDEQVLGDQTADVLAGAEVILYGDSLAVESAGMFRDLVVLEDDDLEVIPASYPGPAICDLEAVIPQDLATYDALEVAVMSFVGNNSTPCVQDAEGEGLTGEALADKYAEDAESVTELLTDGGVQVLWVGAPPSPGLPGGASELIDQAYRDLVDEWADRAPGQVHYAPAGEAVSGPDGEFVSSLPCLDDEVDMEALLEELDVGQDRDDLELDGAAGCNDGEIRVRSDDEIHFCPVEREDDELGCPTYSSGAVRYGEAMAEATLALLDA